MFKKFASIVLTLAFMATLIVVPPVQAEYTNQWTDSFEEGSGAMSGNHYVSSGENGLLIKSASYTSYTPSLKLGPAMGYNGTGGLHVNCTTKMSDGEYWSTGITTRGVTLEENTAVVLSYKIKLLEMEKISSVKEYLFLSGVTGSGRISNSSQSALRYLTPGNNGTTENFEIGKWYTIVTKVTGTGTTKSTTTYVLNEDNTLKGTSTKNITITVGSAYTAATQPIYLWPVFAVSNTAKKDLVFDDISLTKINTSNTQSISFNGIRSNIKDGETGVALDKTFRLAFDHDLASTAADTVKLYKKADTQKTSPIACTVSAKAYDSFLLTPSELELNTEYVLDFSGVTSAQGAAISQTSQSISFKTVDPGEQPIAPVQFVSAAATSGNFTDGTYSNAPLTDAFTLNFDSAILEPTYGTAVKLYKTADNSETAVAATLTMADDEKSFTLTPKAALSLGTNYTIDFAGVKTSLGGAIEGTSAVTFTTIASRAPLYVTDDFEAAATINGSLAGGNYKTSDVLNSFSSYTYVVDNVGIGGGKGLRLNNVGSPNTVTIKTKNFELDESETLFLEYKIKINSLNAASTQAVYLTLTDSTVLYPTSGETIFKMLDYGEKTYITDQGQGRSYAYDSSKWYTMLVKIGRKSQSGYVFDENGNVVLEQNYNMSLSNLVKYEITSISSTNTEISMYLDDFKAYRVQNEAFAPIDSKSTVTNGATGIGTTGDIKLVFNQAFAKFTPDVVGAISFYEGSTKLDATIRRNGGNEIIITPAQSLNAGRTYTIKVANGLTSLSGKAYGGPAEISFTTKTIYNINPVSTTLAIAQDGSISAGSKTLVVDNVGDVVESPVIVVAVYADHRLDKLIGCEVFDVDSLTARENTLEFTLANSYANAGSVKILIYDSMSDLKPLMKAYKITK